MKKGLGRGLSSLFGDYDKYDIEETSEVKSDLKEKTIKKEEKTNVGDEVLQIEIGLIDRNEAQPRKNFDEKALKELASSIKQHGIIQPLILKKNGERYVIVAGERRFRAAKLAGLKAVPAIVKDYSKREISEIAIIENLQREDLNPIESAKAIKNLIDEFDLTQEEVADKIGKSRPAVANTLRLLTLPDEIIDLIENNKLSAGHARTLLSIEDDKKKVELANICIQKKLSVRDLELLVKNMQKPQKEKKKAEQSLELRDFANSLNKILSTKVSIIGNDKKGRIYIDYYSQDDLQRIYDILNR